MLVPPAVGRVGRYAAGQCDVGEEIGTLPRMTAQPDSRPQFDHIIVAVPDPEPVRRLLGDEWGLGLHPTDTSVFGDGIANLIVPLEPPQYLELLYVHDEATFRARASSDLV